MENTDRKTEKKEELNKFRSLLQYFVVHLEYCQYNHNTDKPSNPNWFKDDREGPFVSLIDKKSGHGYLNNAIQKQIEQWCIYPYGRVTISVQYARKGGYTATSSYLHWDKTWFNINAKWSDNRIEYLYFYYKGDAESPTQDKMISRDVLFSENDGVDVVEPLFDAFVNAKKNSLEYKKKTLGNLLKNGSIYNLVLTGAPGTGKTHMTEDIARIIIGVNPGAPLPDDQYSFVQFHPSYDYTDFVEGLRPKIINRKVTFERKDGLFKAFCEKAARCVDDKKYVFVIDEINRGEISKIFGELFFSIDPGYRGDLKNKSSIRTVKTQYQNLIDNDNTLQNSNYSFKKGFFVPNNVYVIGTMNDIDRSVESMDFAFRRRFSFVEITAAESESMLYNRWPDDKTNEAIVRMQRLNSAIIDPQIGGLSEQYQIGAAYFLKLEKLGFDFGRLWDESLRGLLFEYYRGQPDVIAIIGKLKDAYDLKENGKK